MINLRSVKLRLGLSDKRVFPLVEGAITILIIVFVFFNPIPNTTAIKEICFYASIIFLLILLFYKKKSFSLKTVLSWPFFFFVVWCSVDLLFALNKQNSLHDLYAHLIKYIAVYYLLVNFIDSEKKLTSLMWTIILSSAIFSAVGMLHFYYALENSLSTKFGIYQYTELPSNIIGTITIFGMILSIYLLTIKKNIYHRGILILCLCVTSMATLMTQSRSALIAMITSLLIIFPMHKKSVAVLLIALMTAIIVLPVHNILKKDALLEKLRIDDRLNIAFTFLEMIKDYPITGIGFGMQTYYDQSLLDRYNEQVPEKYRQPVPHKAPHNFLIDIAVRTGLLGLGLFLYIIFASLKMTCRLIRYGAKESLKAQALILVAALLALLVQGLFENMMSGPPAIVLYTIFAMMAITWRINSETFQAEQISVKNEKQRSF